MYRRINVLILLSAFFCLTFSAQAEQSINPTLNKCECEEIEVECSDSLADKNCGPNSAACAQTCRLLLRERLCKNHQLSRGSVSIEKFQRSLACNLEAAKADLKNRGDSGIDSAMKRISDCGTILHETFHACVPEEVASNRQGRPCDEWAGNFQEREIFRRTISTFCTPASVKSAEERGFCARLCKEAYSKDLNTNWNRRLCDIVENQPDSEEWIPEKECCAAYKECKGEKLTKTSEWVPEYCKAEVYDKADFQAEIASQLTKVCSILAYSDGGYSCQEMSKNQQPYTKCE